MQWRIGQKLCFTHVPIAPCQCWIEEIDLFQIEFKKKKKTCSRSFYCMGREHSLKSVEEFEWVLLFVSGPFPGQALFFFFFELMFIDRSRGAISLATYRVCT